MFLTNSEDIFMKKITAIILVLMFTVALAACGSGEYRQAQNDLSTALKDFNNSSIDLDGLQSALENYASTVSGTINEDITVEDYIKAVNESDSFKDIVKQTNDAGMDVKLVADGNNVVYKYTYRVDVVENVKEVLENSFKDSEATYVASANAIRAEAPCVEKVVWEYYTKDGAFITSLEK